MTTTELTVIERAAIALGTSERETELRALVTKSNDIVEIKNSAGRDQCHAAAMLLRAARTSIRKVGKDARDDATKFSKAVIAEEDRLVALIEPEETRLLGIRDAWDEAHEAEKRAKLEAAQRRVASIREHIDDIRSFAQRAVGAPSASIAMWIEELQELGITLDRFAELTGEAEAVRDATLDKLRELHAAAVTQETEAARLAAEREELERQRAALAEQQRQEAEARAARERVARQRAENRTAMLASEPTGGNWTAKSGCVVTDVPIPGCVGGGFDDVEHYGGYLIAESIARPADARVLAASRRLLAVAQTIVRIDNERAQLPMDVRADLDRAIEAATGIAPESPVVRLGEAAA
ncbi:hypothetical protein X947_5375 [Burkholderia pseudomallei MSHR7334]|uniref:hypothetical protein n=1 Tax=Burkholderia pseudomallei TaxID=28450 RepID=UPI000531FC1E|nr:hypothetical protein [Burkholderia pseudomallei]KGS75401.1 hypothetical protein X947_5375 [Burkholderia pseudomallei MSHR7334]